MAAGWNGWQTSPRWSTGFTVAHREHIFDPEAIYREVEQRMAARAEAWRQEQRRLWSIRINLLLLVGVLICALF